ncbi:MAG: hypothetical protein JWN25_826 [Verrucomicrobiales bacterium]|nr:hypothetical protein [Verrucomicrobiales bacterium]
MLCLFVFILHGSFDFFDWILVTSHPTNINDARGLALILLDPKLGLFQKGHFKDRIRTFSHWLNFRFRSMFESRFDLPSWGSWMLRD